MNIFQYFSEVKFLEDPRLLFPMLIWIMVWKGIALWKASQRKEVLWFWLLMVINTLGLLEISYIFVFSKPKNNFNFLKKIANKKEEVKEEIKEEEDNQ